MFYPFIYLHMVVVWSETRVAAITVSGKPLLVFVFQMVAVVEEQGRCSDIIKVVLLYDVNVFVINLFLAS